MDFLRRVSAAMVLVLLSLSFPAQGEVEPVSEAVRLLNGAKTLTLKLSVFTKKGCDVDQLQLQLLLEQLIGGYGKVKKVDESSVPDIHVTLNVDIAALPPDIEPTELCMYTVSARAIHPIMGQLRYKAEPVLIQALTFNQTLFSVIVPSKINEAVQLQSMKVMNLLFAAHRAGAQN